MKQLLLVTFSILVTATIAEAQAPVYQWPPQPLGPAPTIVVPATPPVTTTPPPVTIAPPAPTNQVIVVPEGSMITVFNNGVRQEYQKYSAQGTVRTFDSWNGRMTLQEGTVVTFPRNYAFTQVPEVGQPVKVTYFTDQNGNNIATSLDSGTSGRQ